MLRVGGLVDRPGAGRSDLAIGPGRRTTARKTAIHQENGPTCVAGQIPLCMFKYLSMKSLLTRYHPRPDHPLDITSRTGPLRAQATSVSNAIAHKISNRDRRRKDDSPCHPRALWSRARCVARCAGTRRLRIGCVHIDLRFEVSSRSIRSLAGCGWGRVKGDPYNRFVAEKESCRVVVFMM